MYKFTMSLFPLSILCYTCAVKKVLDTFVQDKDRHSTVIDLRPGGNGSSPVPDLNF